MLLKTQTGNRLFLELRKGNFFPTEAFPSLSRQSMCSCSLFCYVRMLTLTMVCRYTMKNSQRQTLSNLHTTKMQTASKHYCPCIIYRGLTTVTKLV